ncbi:hypothetical protein HKX48_002967 [Thoreauomyces humboldtii]|nr:hypothetical protein HKX48_002967 [Thoreauomyces humboldtii]
MPRAWDYAHFIQGLNGTSNPRWKAVDSVRDLQAGDLVAWEIPGWNVTGKSTGHVVIVAPPPSKAPGHEGRMIVPDGERSVWVGVLDASSVRHRWDTRCGWGGDEGVISRTCLGGVGHAFIRLLMDAKGRPVAFQFHEQAVVRNYPISLARLSDEREKPAVPFAS